MPMVSLADDDLTVTLELDADILVGDAGDYTLFDALSGAMLDLRLPTKAIARHVLDHRREPNAESPNSILRSLRG